MKPNSKQFEKLRQKWYSKLKKDGFDDIEDSSGNIKNLHKSKFLPSKHKGTSYEGIKLRNDAKQEYYRFAEQFLHDYPFDTKLEQLIWQYHSEGIGYRHIPAELKKHRFTMGHDSVRKKIDELKKIMLDKALKHE